MARNRSPLAASQTFGMTESGKVMADILLKVGTEIRQQIIEKAVDEVGRTMADSMRALAPVRSGSLQLAVAHKTVNYPSNSTAVTIAGIRRRLRFLTPRGVAIPSKYAHLVERGFIGRDGKFHHPKSPFIGPAVEAVASRSAQIMANIFVREMDKAVKKTNPQ